MLRKGTSYVFGLSATKHHLLVNPFSADVLEALAPRLAGLRVLKRTVAIPSDWKVDAALLRAMVRLRLAELA